MRLPDIDYGGTVQSTVQTAALPGEAAAGATRVISEGLRAYSQELIKSQQIEAALRVSEGLDQAKNAISSRKYITRKELEDSLGGEIPPELAERTKIYGDNPVAQIPMFAVGDTLFAHQAKKVAESATEGIDGPGWRTHFSEGIAKTVLDAKQALAQHHLQALDTYQQETQRQQIRRAVAMRNYPAAMEIVLGTIDQRSTLPAAERQQWRDEIEMTKQRAPTGDALLSQDPAVIAAEIKRLTNDPAAKVIPEPQRLHDIAALQVKERAFETLGWVDRIWTASEGDPAKAIDAARALPDPLMAKDVEEAVSHRATQAHTLQRMQDEPREGRLDQAISRYGLLNRASNDYTLLSDPGKARVEAAYLAFQRSQRAVGSEDRRAQSDLDAQRQAEYRAAMNDAIQAGKDPATVEAPTDVSPKAKAAMAVDRSLHSKEWTKDKGVTLSAFHDRAEALAQNLGYSPGKGGQAEEFKTYMDGKFMSWMAANPGKPAPTDEEVRKMFADEILYGDESGGGWTRNRPAWTNRKQGLPHKAFAETDQPDRVKEALQGLRTPPPPAKPAPPVSGAVLVTDGLQQAWLPPGKPMPAGWKAAP